jgi:hypothetical protein
MLDGDEFRIILARRRGAKDWELEARERQLRAAQYGCDFPKPAKPPKPPAPPTNWRDWIDAETMWKAITRAKFTADLVATLGRAAGLFRAPPLNADGASTR